MPDRNGVEPNDPYNQELLSQVRPADWRNPQPAARYNLVVIGAGTAGLVAASLAAGLGGKVALLEKQRLGGDCLNVGCVPSKALLRCARAAADVYAAGEFGVEVSGYQVNFPAIMARLRKLRASISHSDSARRLQDKGVDVFFGDAYFSGPDTVQIGDAGLRFTRALIATGTHPVQPPIPGLAEMGYFTNETIFQQTELPRRLAVIGGGPIGAELAQAFACFGSEVTLLQRGGQLLAKEDADAARILEAALRRAGVRLLLSAAVERAERRGSECVLHYRHEGQTQEATADAVLAAVGRSPTVQGLQLETAAMDYDDRHGVHVSDYLRTSNPRIYAAGDICSPFRFTHAADAMARLAVRNALFLGRGKVSALTIPWCTYTDPELAHVGLYEHEARARGIAVQTFQQDLCDVDRAVLDGETVGFVRIHVRRGTDRILGATIVARHAGDMIAELTLAMANKLGLKTISASIHPYPTQSEAIKKTGDTYMRSRLTPFFHSLLSKWLAWWR